LFILLVKIIFVVFLHNNFVFLLTSLKLSTVLSVLCFNRFSFLFVIFTRGVNL